MIWKRWQKQKHQTKVADRKWRHVFLGCVGEQGEKNAINEDAIWAHASGEQPHFHKYFLAHASTLCRPVNATILPRSLREVRQGKGGTEEDVLYTVRVVLIQHKSRSHVEYSVLVLLHQVSNWKTAMHCLGGFWRLSKSTKSLQESQRGKKTTKCFKSWHAHRWRSSKGGTEGYCWEAWISIKVLWQKTLWNKMKRI